MDYMQLRIIEIPFILDFNIPIVDNTIVITHCLHPYIGLSIKVEFSATADKTKYNC